MSEPIFIGYELAGTTAAVTAGMLRPPGNMSREDTIAKWRAETMQAVVEGEVQCPYMASVSRILAVRPWQQEFKDFKPSEDEGIPTLQFVQWLLAEYPGAWPNVERLDDPPVLLIGFGMLLFRRFLGLEPSMPVHWLDKDQPQPVPLSMWRCGEVACDLETLVVPPDVRLELASVLRLRGIKRPKAWRLYKDAEADSRIAAELAVQLGVVTLDGPPAEANDDEEGAEDETGEGDVGNGDGD